MNRKTLLLTLLSLATVFAAETPPVFPKQYELGFTEKASLGPISGNTTGKIYLDEVNNRERVSRANGHHDRYCGSVFKFADTPCNHFVVDGKRFLDFPEKRYCCFCCDGAHGCGITATNWLVTANASYSGTQKLEDGGTYEKWEIKGLQTNFYYHKNDAIKTPRRLYQVSDDLMDFTDYFVGIKSPDVFNLPSYCTEKCGLTTICAGLRKDKLLQSE